MNTNRFIHENLVAEARITIAHVNGEIWYEGDVMSLCNSIAKGTTVESISLGSYFDIIIVVK